MIFDPWLVWLPLQLAEISNGNKKKESSEIFL
jgi:hypothetical protein